MDVSIPGKRATEVEVGPVLRAADRDFIHTATLPPVLMHQLLCAGVWHRQKILRN